MEEFEAGTTSVTDPIDVPNDGAVGESGGHLQEAKGESSVCVCVRVYQCDYFRWTASFDTA